MPLIVKDIIKQEPASSTTDGSSSFASIRDKALKNSNIPQTQAIINKVAQIDPQTSRDLENASREAERLRAEILELKRARQALHKAKEEDLEQGVSLVVDGEKRKVAKTSRYLLDMLTLDDQ
jgi:hypothetical protein